MAKLIVLSGDLTGKTLDLIGDRLTLGRLGDNDLRIDDKTVSGHHCVLTFDGQDYIIKDLNSTNGSRVNGRRVVETRLGNGDVVRIGSVELRYESEQRKVSQPLPPPSRGVDLTTITPASLQPTSMTSASPFPRRTNKTSWILNGIIALLVVVALVAIVLAFVKLSKGP
jgi:pSer/pThr/pTyr-binding forkhead associated (FHA) protein